MCAKYWSSASGRLAQERVDRITDRPNMTSAVYRGRKASTQTNNKIQFKDLSYVYKCLIVYLSLMLTHIIKLYIIRHTDIQNGSGTPRPKTISARDSTAQIEFFLLGLLGPGLLGPVIKMLICGI